MRHDHRTAPALTHSAAFHLLFGLALLLLFLAVVIVVVGTAISAATDPRVTPNGLPLHVGAWLLVAAAWAGIAALISDPAAAVLRGLRRPDRRKRIVVLPVVLREVPRRQEPAEPVPDDAIGPDERQQP